MPLPDVVEFLVDPNGQRVPYADVVWTPPDSTGVARPDWEATAVRGAMQEPTDG